MSVNDLLGTSTLTSSDAGSQTDLESITLSSGSSVSGSTRSGNSSYTGLRKDVLYCAINELQLPDALVSSYTDLLHRTGFDLTHLVIGGELWYPCLGKTCDRRPCKRLVPESYFRMAVGSVLRAATQKVLQDDDLIEELSIAFSYAICSEHHPTVHKIARAIEAQSVVESWRQDHKFPRTEGVRRPATPPRNPLRCLRQKGEAAWPSKAPQTLVEWDGTDGEEDDDEDYEDDDDDEPDLNGCTMPERLMVEKLYQQSLSNCESSRWSSQRFGKSIRRRGSRINLRVSGN